ncbi:hypothetical protein CI109_104450 [Kwoniella shandongensis]|uniref:Glutathione S-transferase kappa n=1 Tax=Kwoniella shandongensis TaxID=1734106 RepID=A0A5M6BQH1_9TREE|nr:uncharacterized protein CI109_007300 [Kwoniella shandongensis]KAA5524352.1 hypothetical protein CI109_007300 [Kwoniella shandongensis]
MFLTSPPPLRDTIELEVYYGVSSPWALLGAPKLHEIAEQYGLTVYLKPITIITENGGIPLKARHDARRAYHALDLIRTAKHLKVDLKPNPKYYPNAPNGIAQSAQAIIRLQLLYGIGSKEALEFSYQVQRCIWVTEEGDHCQLDTLRGIASRMGLSDEVVERVVVDRRSDPSDPAVKIWYQNHKEGAEKGMFGTPNYVLNGEIFWGQDRLWMLEERVKELLANGAKPVQYNSPRQ